MPEIDLHIFHYLIVDDVRLCRLNVLGILKNLKCANYHCAGSGAEAASILENEAERIDCVITDLDMPEMNGLQLLKAIRMGIPNVRRDLPVALLTGHGDEALVGLALALDVNTFLLKPANKTMLVKRLSQILYNDLAKEQWIRSVAHYAAIDVNAPLSELVQRSPEEIAAPKLEAVQEASSGSLCLNLDGVPENAVLDRTVSTHNGRIVYEVNTVLTNQHLTRLKGLRDLGFLDNQLWVTPPQRPAATSTQKKEMPSIAAVLKDEDANVSTFARFGKLDFGAKVECMRCSQSFAPDREVVRLHNRRDLLDLYCPNCQQRDNELLCACVKLMILKDGFPLTPEQIESAFEIRDPGLSQNKDDPFEELRENYEDDPLSRSDLKRWIRNNYFSPDKSGKKVECMIDRILENPERVLLLGKEGLLARRMAMSRSKKSPQGVK